MRGRLRWLSCGFSGAVLVLGACGDDDGGGDTAPPTTSTVVAGSSTTEVVAAVTTIADAVTSATTAGEGATVEVTTTVAETVEHEDAVVPESFDVVTITVTAADGSVEEFCVWLAETMQQQQRGLMDVTDLGGAAGMLFVYDHEVVHRFWMYNTPMPLSIAFFDASGELVSAADMEPCIDRPTADCPRYTSTGPYQYALEVPHGDLPALGIGAGATIEVAITAGDPDHDSGGCGPL